MSNLPAVIIRFDAAFPWFDYERWSWHYEPVAEGGSAYKIPGARADAFGEIAIYMPGAGAERFLAVQQWLIAEFNPARAVPATRHLDMEKIGRRDGGHNSDMPGPRGR